MTEPERSAAILRAIPKVDRLLGAEEMQPLLAAHSRKEVVRELRSVLEGLRRDSHSLDAAELSAAAISRRIAEGLARRALPYYRRVVNGTGVVLHTGLGRAVLAPEAVAALAELAGHPQRVEIDLETGVRGGRDEGCAVLLRELTGCEDATVVNNNAAATLLLLAATARGQGVILSRGELVEIGGSFRIPEVMRESGAILVEVGTTNRTHLRDYAEAIDERTGMILKVHTSNYRIEGFTAEVEIEDLVTLGREHGVIVAHDLGSGCAVDLASRGLAGEPLLRRSVAAGADLVCFSGDKLLGGPQAGIILGCRDAVERCRHHPLFRAMRPGRLVYTALEATLRLYGAGEAAAYERVPALRQLTASASSLRVRARRLARRLAGCPQIAVSVTPCTSQAGSGALPAREIESWGVRVVPASHSAQELAALLRTGDPAILARIHEDAVLFDVRTLSEDELALIERRLRGLALA
ncbi:MAG TPA: L-seryl-tRNA(Sec) selenium transferase [Thermoanaerobaculia bacterium]|jgi:L-seryl-tRNA(Ser) seleniumtransferase|nr:L-seryl-tRNA(Sec) selenium transferase [Thermoanaerobaculia bacterium]